MTICISSARVSFSNYSTSACIRWQMFFKIGVLENFATFTWKHLCWILFHKASSLARLLPLKGTRKKCLLYTRSTSIRKKTLHRKIQFINLLFHKLTTAQKMHFSIKDSFSKCDQIHSFRRIWSHLLQKFLILKSLN